MKKSFFKKLMICGMIAISTMMAGSGTAVAAAEPVKVLESNEMTEIEARADILELHFRTVNGVLQYRIWNRTRGRWENDWTDF